MQKETRNILFSEAIYEATDQLLEEDSSVYMIGLGVPDPKGIFGTTTGLEKKYGPSRIFDMPISENAMTGVVIGSAMMGSRPILSHQRLDFSLLSLDQLINNASKWHYMFGGEYKVPLTIRMIIGRGWGQGPQHSQSLHSLFTHIPGLKVVAPASSYDAKGLFIASVKDENPVIFLEHRWLHFIHGPVPTHLYEVPLGKANIVTKGSDLTVVASSYMTIEGYKAIEMLKKECSIELIDLRTLIPLDKETIFESVRKTKRLLVLDGDWKTCGFSSEIISLVAEEGISLDHPPVRITYPDLPQGSSWVLANHYYPTAKEIASTILKMLAKQKIEESLQDILEKKMKVPFDQPDPSFCGPF